MRLRESELVQHILVHRTKEYGAMGHNHAGIVKQLIDAYGPDVLDYGCGKQTLSDALGMPIQGYDPAVAGLDTEPTPATIVVCINVLEFILEEDLDDVLEHIASKMKKIGVFVIATTTSVLNFVDEKNAHRTVKPPTWWLNKLSKHFDVQQFAKNPKGREFMLTVNPRGTDQKEFEAAEEHLRDSIDTGAQPVFFVQPDGQVKGVRYGVETGPHSSNGRAGAL